MFPELNETPMHRCAHKRSQDTVVIVSSSCTDPWFMFPFVSYISRRGTNPWLFFALVVMCQCVVQGLIWQRNFGPSDCTATWDKRLTRTVCALLCLLRWSDASRCSLPHCVEPVVPKKTDGMWEHFVFVELASGSTKFAVPGKTS